LEYINDRSHKTCEYNALYDKHLGNYFSSKRNYKVLVSSGILKKNGVFGEKESLGALENSSLSESKFARERRNFMINKAEIMNAALGQVQRNISIMEADIYGGGVLDERQRRNHSLVNRPFRTIYEEGCDDIVYLPEIGAI